MINASAEFKQKIKGGAEVKTYADITLNDGTVLHLSPDDIMIGGCTIDDKTTDGKFGVGFVIGKTLSLRIANHDERFSLYDFYNSIINLYVAMQLDNGTVEKIRKGVYYTTIPETPGDVIEISAADGIHRLDRDYANSGTVYPASLQTIITEACLDCGIPIGFRQFDNMSFTVQEKPEKATYRQVVSWACQIAGYNARIDNNGYMQLVWYNTALLDRKVYDGGDFLIYPHEKTLDGGDFFDYSVTKIIDGGLFTDACPEHIFRFKSLTVHTDDVVITGVQVVHEDTDILFGENEYVIKAESNPFVAGKENQVATYLGQRMVGIRFRPFSGSVLGNPLYEPFDVCKVSDRKGNAYQSIINSVSYTVGSYTEIACQAEDPVRNGSSYYSEAAAAVVEARRNAEKQITEYDKAVQNMNQIAMNAMGFHTTYEEQPDGSRITYLHDKPTLEESQTIYKQTIDGFFISQDGGRSYTSGFDSQGNAVLNILYAIGIVCDWIHGGTLTLGGFSDINGEMHILDSNGEMIGSWNKDGFMCQSVGYKAISSPPYYFKNSSFSYPYYNSLTSGDFVASYLIIFRSEYSGSVFVKFKNPNVVFGVSMGPGKYDADIIYEYKANNGRLVLTVSNWFGDKAYAGYIWHEMGYNGLTMPSVRYGDVEEIWAGEGIEKVQVYTGGNASGNISDLKYDYKTNYVTSFGKGMKINSIESVIMSDNFKLDNGGILLYFRPNEIPEYDNTKIRNLERNRISFDSDGIRAYAVKYDDDNMMSVYEYMNLDTSLVGGGLKFDDPYAEKPVKSYFGLDGVKHTKAYEQLSFSGLAKRALYVGSDGTISAASSSRRYKQDITSELDSYFDPKGIYNLPVCQARYRKEYGGGDDSPLYITFIAEDVAKYFPAAARWNKDHTEVDTWEMSDMFPAVVKLIQDQHTEIEDLKTRLEKLEMQMEEFINGSGNRKSDNAYPTRS